ncbi:hypothetical protein GCM10027047_06210 [Rhodococcus aerolatus]
MGSPLDVTPDALDEAARALVAAAAAVEQVGTSLEGRCLTQPRVGDVQAAAAFGQAHYDWAQTRFEDLVASAEQLDHQADLLRATATRYRGADTDGASGIDEAPGQGRAGGPR